MKDLSELGLEVKSNAFKGEKIKIKKILNQKISVHDFKVKPSKYEGSGDCLHLQIEFEKEMRVVFTRGSALIALLEQVDKKNDLPFKTMIVREDDNGPFEFRSAL